MRNYFAWRSTSYYFPITTDENQRSRMRCFVSKIASLRFWNVFRIFIEHLSPCSQDRYLTAIAGHQMQSPQFLSYALKVLVILEVSPWKPICNDLIKNFHQIYGAAPQEGFSILCSVTSWVNWMARPFEITLYSSEFSGRIFRVVKGNRIFHIRKMTWM